MIDLFSAILTTNMILEQNQENLNRLLLSKKSNINADYHISEKDCFYAHINPLARNIMKKMSKSSKVNSVTGLPEF